MKDLNRIELKGRVGGTEAIHYVGESQVIRFTLATSRSFRDANGEWQAETTWHRIECWSGFGRCDLNRITKGTKLYVCGRIKNDSYTDQNGNERTNVVVLADECDVIVEPLESDRQ